MDEHALAILRLHLTGRVGIITFKKLVNAFGSAEAALAAPESRLSEVAGIGKNAAREIASGRSKSAAAAEREIELAGEQGVKIVTRADDDYPPALNEIYDPPLVLYVKGELTKRDRLACAIVGTRRCTYYGRSQAERIASHLAGLGITIVSGLARGIDSAAHRGALAAGGRTIAVMGCGLARVYPPENEELAAEIVEHGALVSEFPMEVGPARENFPRRNRVISGMSLGVLVVEGSMRSGAMITANFANEQGRQVYALPGKVDTPGARGPHRLIKDGAKLVEGPEDILDELGPAADSLELDRVAQEPDEPDEPDGVDEADEEAGEAEEAPDAEAESARAKPKKRKRAKAPSSKKSVEKAYPGLSPTEKKLLAALSTDPRDIDDITAETELSPAEVSAGLLVLEIRRLAKQLPGKRFVRLR
ncbi:MAG: DNA-processing protein DprA [Planctomycetota bacterium]|jgi:DNA processing protein